MRIRTLVSMGGLIAGVACSADPHVDGAPGGTSGGGGLGILAGTGSGGVLDAHAVDQGGAGGGAPDARGVREAGGDARDGGTVIDAKRERDEPLGPCSYADWSPTVTYGPGEVVMWLGAAYVAIGHNTGRNPAVDSLYWSPYDDCQAPPPPLCNYPPWSRDATYKRADIALHWAIAWIPKPYIALANNGEGTNIVGGDPANTDLSWKEYGGCTPQPPPPTTTCALLDPLLPNGENTFRLMFTPDFHSDPLDVYSYSSLCKVLATPGLTAFVRSGNALQDKRELAAFFAHVADQTGYLGSTDEVNSTPDDQDFHGRGALQVSGAANYAAFAMFLGITINGNQELLSQDPGAWQSGIWYWMFHSPASDGGGGTSRDAIVQADFGRTVRLIKKDCTKADEVIAQYKKNCVLLNVDPGSTACQ